LRAAVESTGATSFGAFAGLHPLDGERLLAASTDGVGTKLILARARGRLRDCGADLAAHCINDVLTCGAEPLMLLDYVAANEIRLEEVAELVEGAAAVCREAGSHSSVAKRPSCRASTPRVSSTLQAPPSVSSGAQT